MKSILIVDDDPASLVLVEGVLEAEGYETRKASAPVQALEILKAGRPTSSCSTFSCTASTTGSSSRAGSRAISPRARCRSSPSPPTASDGRRRKRVPPDVTEYLKADHGADARRRRPQGDREDRIRAAATVRPGGGA